MQRVIQLIGKAVIFDLDGTLLDTLRDLGEAVNAVLRKHGFSEHPLDSYRYFVGEGVETLIRLALPEQERVDSMIKKLLVEIREEYEQRWRIHTRAYPGVPDMLKGLELRKVPKTVLSNKVHHVTVEMVKSLLGTWSFETVRGALPGVPRKPDPKVALEIAREMNIPPAEVVFVGDTGIDMQTARTAGMYAAGVLWGFRDAEELLEAGAQTLLAAPHELLDLFV